MQIMYKQKSTIDFWLAINIRVNFEVYRNLENILRKNFATEK